VTTPAPAVWHGGVHLGGTPIWCDAPRRRELCFVSAIDAVGPIRHGQLIATTTTLGLLRGHSPTPLADSQLAVPLGRPFTLGELRLELFASGHLLGAASLKVEGPAGAVVYGGVVHPEGSALAGPGDVRRADCLIVSGRYGHPRFRFPPRADAVAAIAERIDRILGRGGSCVLVVDSDGLGLEVIAALARTAPVLASRRICDLARSARQLGYAIPRSRVLRAPLRPGNVVVATADRIPAERPRGSEVIPVSGRDADPDVVISDGADWSGLLDYIEQSSAREVLVTERLEPELELELRRRGVLASPLGPPEQLPLPWGHDPPG
jgi:putative mRNA 3-end processing factor